MQFDFSGLKYDTPAHLDCIRADKDCFTLADNNHTRFYRIRKMEPEVFGLWSWSHAINGPSELNEGQFVMRGTLEKVLQSIGYFKRNEKGRRAFLALQRFLFDNSDEPVF